jgi:hypothetical protein
MLVVRQETLTVVARVAGAPPFTTLREALHTLARDRMPGGGARPRVFAEPALGIHFARLVLLEEPSAGAHSSSLIFESNFDTVFEDPAEARFEHLKLLCQTIPAPLTSLFQHCSGFAPDGNAEQLLASLSERQVQSSAAYQGHIDRDLTRTRWRRGTRGGGTPRST